jgi:hypothetical protein
MVYIYRLFFIEASKVPVYKKEGFTINKDIIIADVTDIDTGSMGSMGSMGYIDDTGNDNQSFNQFYATIYQDLFYRDFVDDYEVGIILNKIQPVRQTDALVIGSKTGKHVDALAKRVIMLVD